MGRLLDKRPFIIQKAPIFYVVSNKLGMVDYWVKAHLSFAKLRIFRRYKVGKGTLLDGRLFIIQETPNF